MLLCTSWFCLFNHFLPKTFELYIVQLTSRQKFLVFARHHVFLFIWVRGLSCRQDIHSSSGVPIQPTPTLASSRSLQSSCCCWTVFGSFGVSSPWRWVSLRRCSSDWQMRSTLQTTARFCATMTRRGQFSTGGFFTQYRLQCRAHQCWSLKLTITFRCAMQVKDRTHCLFQALLRPPERDYYSNPLYEPNELAIWPSVHPQSLQLWRGELESD